MKDATYNLVFKDRTRPPYKLTSGQGMQMKLFLKDNKESFLELPCGEFVQKFEIKGLQPIKKGGTHAFAGRTTTCEYGKKHPFEDDCHCRKEEWGGHIWLTVWDHFKKINPELMYNSQITEKMVSYAKGKML